MTVADVWIIGSSIIYWAEQRARVRLDTNLRLENTSITWLSRRGMRRCEAVPLLLRRLEQSRKIPDMIVIHCGGNSLVEVRLGYLAKAIKDDIGNLSKKLHFLCTIIWSDMLPRLTWRGAIAKSVIEIKRRNLNRCGRRAVLKAGGRVIEHPEITEDTAGLFRDGVHLSDIGSDILLCNLQYVINACRFESADTPVIFE